MERKKTKEVNGSPFGVIGHGPVEIVGALKAHVIGHQETTTSKKTMTMRQSVEVALFVKPPRPEKDGASR